jgi:hypothetical protein
MTSAVSEAFGNCPPDVAGRQDYEACVRIMQLRRYRDVKHEIDSSTKDNPVPDSVTKSAMAAVWNQVMHAKQDEVKP